MNVNDRLLYHWSPAERRAVILRRGLVPGSLSTDDEWNPPYVCFADSPSRAWGLSGATSRGAECPEWDLWMVWASVMRRVEVIFEEPEIFLDELLAVPPLIEVKEYRVYASVPVEDVWYVATRHGEV